MRVLAILLVLWVLPALGKPKDDAGAAWWKSVQDQTQKKIYRGELNSPAEAEAYVQQRYQQEVKAQWEKAAAVQQEAWKKEVKKAEKAWARHARRAQDARKKQAQQVEAEWKRQMKNAGRAAYHATPAGAAGPLEGVRPWKEQVGEARSMMKDADAAMILEAVGSRYDPAVFVGLEMAHRRKLALPEARLTAALADTGHARVARAAGFMLSRLGTESARRTLAAHVAREGAASQSIRGYLGKSGAGEIASARRLHQEKETLMRRAADVGGPLDRRGLAAIDALAEVPGRDVSRLLEDLARDSSTTIRERAEKALAVRAQASGSGGGSQ